MPDHPILYSFRRCPYAMRARLAIASAQQRVELREVVLKDKPPEMLVASPKATVPVLQIGDDVIDESLEIMQWALNRNDPDNWLSGVTSPIARHPLVQANDNDFKPLLDRYKYFDRYPEQSQDVYLQQSLPFLQQLNEQLQQQGGHLNSAQFSAIDAAIFPFIRQFAHADLNQFKQLALPDLHRWLDNCLDSELFRICMLKYPAWSAAKSNAITFA